MRTHIRPHVGGHSSSGGASDQELVFVCIVIGGLILIALLCAIEKHCRASDDGAPTDPEQLRRAREMIVQRRR